MGAQHLSLPEASLAKSVDQLPFCTVLYLESFQNPVPCQGTQFEGPMMSQVTSQISSYYGPVSVHPSMTNEYARLRFLAKEQPIWQRSLTKHGITMGTPASPRARAETVCCHSCKAGVGNVHRLQASSSRFLQDERPGSFGFHFRVPVTVWHGRVC